MSSDILQQFAERLRESGFVVDHVEADGVIHRGGTIDKPRGTDGAYMAFWDFPPTVWWKNWCTGEEGTWCAVSDSEMSQEERKALKARIEQAKAEARREQAERWEKAAERAKRIWNALPAATDNHPYLRKKEVPSFGLRVTNTGRLVVPVLGESGKVQSLQFVLPEKPAEGSDKFFLGGGKTAGGYFPIPAKDGSRSGPLLIAEGYATAASLHMATGYACLVAFNAGNLEAVARMARGKYSDRELVLCADNDCETTKPDGTPFNTGVEAATKAASVIGGKLAVCPALDGGKADFNDLHTRRSLEAVRQAVEKARASEPLGGEPLPAGFRLRTGGSLPGLWHIEEKESGEPVETWIGPPLHVLGATRTKDSTAWGLLLAWDDPDGKRHTWAMPRSLLMSKDSSAWLGRLADEGWAGAAGTRARKLLGQYLATLQDETTGKVCSLHRVA